MTNTPIQSPSPFLIPPFAASGDVNAIGFWPQIPFDQEEFDSHPFKKPRFSDEAPRNPIQYPQQIPVMTIPPNPLPLPPPPTPLIPPQSNRVVNTLFFKTRLCGKFKSRTCPYGNNCSFAHGHDELRRAPPNWQEIVAREDDRLPGNWNEQQRNQQNRICRKFYYGEGCPYGDKCAFLHEERRFRESSAISVGSIGAAVPITGVHGSGSHQSESTGLVASGGGCNGFNEKPPFWKTMICHKWEITGHCPFGEKCHFAHGYAELKKFGANLELDNLNVGAVPSKSLSNPTKDVSPSKMEPTSQQKRFLKWKGPKKISLIYGDWIEEIPPFTVSSPTKD